MAHLIRRISLFILFLVIVAPFAHGQATFPSVTSMTPSSAPSNNPAFTFTIQGVGFETVSAFPQGMNFARVNFFPTNQPAPLGLFPQVEEPPDVFIFGLNILTPYNVDGDNGTLTVNIPQNLFAQLSGTYSISVDWCEDSCFSPTSFPFTVSQSSPACSTIINNALNEQALGKNICATFTPNQQSGLPPAPGNPGLTLAQAAQVCGFKDFDWVQQKTVQFDPSPFFARNVAGTFDSKVNDHIRLTSKRVPWNDPPQGGGYADGSGGDPTPDNSFPFYYDQNGELAGHENGRVPDACSLTASEGNTLTFHDAPADGCLPGGELAGTLPCTDAMLAPGAKTEPKGSFGAFVTHLAGVNFDGTATDLGIGFTWISNNNGSTGGVSINKTDLPADDNGTGSVMITSVNEITTLGGVMVTGVSGPGTGTPAILVSPTICDGVFTGTFDGNIRISPGQNCTFVNGNITGDVQAYEGNLTLSGVLIGGNVHVKGGTFLIGPSTTINGNLDANNMLPGSQNQICGSIVSGNLQLHNNGSSVQVGASSESVCVGNVIGGNLNVKNNTGPTAIFNNTVEGNLQCKNNSSITGNGNIAGQKQDQCTEF